MGLTPRKLGLRVFSAHNWKRSIFFCPTYHLAGKRWGRSLQKWHSLHFCTSTKTVAPEQCLRFLLFYKNLPFNEKNEAVHDVKSHLSIQTQEFLTQRGAHISFMLLSMERTILAKASLGLEKLYSFYPEV